MGTDLGGAVLAGEHPARDADRAAVIGPVVVVLALFVRSRRPGPVETAVLIAVAIVLPLLRLLPRLSIAARAAGLIAVFFSLSVFMLARIGFTPGLAITLATTCVLGDIYLGRRFGFLLVVASGLAFFVVGLLVSDGTVTLTPERPGPDAAAQLGPHGAGDVADHRRC